MNSGEAPEQTCQCPMTWGCKSVATRGDGLCDECRTGCVLSAVSREPHCEDDLYGPCGCA